jgi:predicted nuclease of predicted toxin-antitoxin system
MALKLYMDQNVPRVIVIGLRLRGVDVITAYEDGGSLLTDPELLDRAGKLGRVLFTQDDDLLVEAAKTQKEGVFFRGVIYAHQLGVSIGACIRDLEMIARVGESEDLLNRVEYLPL